MKPIKIEKETSKMEEETAKIEEIEIKKKNFENRNIFRGLVRTIHQMSFDAMRRQVRICFYYFDLYS